MQPNIKNPGYLSSIADPCFHTKIIEIGPPPGLTTHGFPVTDFIPFYSRADAWNMDGAKYLSSGSKGWGQLLNGTTFAYIKELRVGVNDNSRWSETDPNILYLFPGLGNQLVAYDIRTDTTTVVKAWPEYAHVLHGAEGNFDKSGKYIALMGQDNAWGTIDVFAYDLQTNTTGQKLNIPSITTKTINWISMSPSGTYVLICWNYPEGQARFEGVEVYDRNMNFLRQLTWGNSHGDVGIDADGSDIYVSASNAPGQSPTVYNTFYKYVISTGAQSVALVFDYYAAIGHHISLRNTNVKGWALISTYDVTLADLQDTWLPLEQEVFALKLDGSEEVRRIAHHHSFWPYWTGSTWDGDYFAEPHATVNKNFTKVTFGSNWVNTPSATQPISTSHYGYVVDLNPTGNVISPTRPSNLRIR